MAEPITAKAAAKATVGKPAATKGIAPKATAEPATVKAAAKTTTGKTGSTEGVATTGKSAAAGAAVSLRHRV